MGISAQAEAPEGVTASRGPAHPRSREAWKRLGQVPTDPDVGEVAGLLGGPAVSAGQSHCLGRQGGQSWSVSRNTQRDAKFRPGGVAPRAEASSLFGPGWDAVSPPELSLSLFSVITLCFYPQALLGQNFPVTPHVKLNTPHMV